jgi:hypothetical protein
LKLVRVQSTTAINFEKFFYRVIVWIPLILILSSMILSYLEITEEQGRSSDFKSRKEELEVKKLELEVSQLKSGQLLPWITAFGGVVIGVAGIAIPVGVSRKQRLGALDQSMHEKRIQSYPKLVEATAPLALYFPPTKSVDPQKCREIGESMRVWYFTDGGLILSKEARDAYFDLARALTIASLFEEKLNVPLFPRDAKKISKEQVNDYREELKSYEVSPESKKPKYDISRVEDWQFGASGSKTIEDFLKFEDSLKFKDFLLLQELSSTLRTKLTEDLRSRRRPDST